jgi:hypothetical protein
MISVTASDPGYQIASNSDALFSSNPDPSPDSLELIHVMHREGPAPVAQRLGRCAERRAREVPVDHVGKREGEQGQSRPKPRGGTIA